MFLYESLWCLAVFGILLWVERRFRLRKSQLVALYVSLYTFGRFWFENMRIDYAHHIAGLRVNAWVSIGICLVGVVWFVIAGRHAPPADRPDKSRVPPVAADSDEPVAGRERAVTHD